MATPILEEKGIFVIPDSAQFSALVADEVTACQDRAAQRGVGLWVVGDVAAGWGGGWRWFLG